MNGQREALGVIDQEVEDQETFAQETLAEVQDILSGAYEEARTILGIDAGGGGAGRTGVAGTRNVTSLRGKKSSSVEKIKSVENIKSGAPTS
jgi:hypothetical protein